MGKKIFNNLFSILGMLTGLVSVCLGVKVAGSSHGMTMSTGVEFGADYYTYSYQAAAATASNVYHSNIILAEGLGYILCVAGIIAFCAFGHILLKSVCGEAGQTPVPPVMPVVDPMDELADDENLTEDNVDVEFYEMAEDGQVESPELTEDNVEVEFYEMTEEKAAEAEEPAEAPVAAGAAVVEDETAKEVIEDDDEDLPEELRPIPIPISERNLGKAPQQEEVIEEASAYLNMVDRIQQSKDEALERAAKRGDMTMAYGDNNNNNAPTNGPRQFPGFSQGAMEDMVKNLQSQMNIMDEVREIQRKKAEEKARREAEKAAEEAAEARLAEKHAARERELAGEAAPAPANDATKSEKAAGKIDADAAASPEDLVSNILGSIGGAQPVSPDGPIRTVDIEDERAEEYHGVKLEETRKEQGWVDNPFEGEYDFSYTDTGKKGYKKSYADGEEEDASPAVKVDWDPEKIEAIDDSKPAMPEEEWKSLLQAALEDEGYF